MGLKFITHENNFIRRYDYEVILGKHIDAGTSILIADAKRMSDWQPATVISVKKTELMRAVRIDTHLGMSLESRKGAILPDQVFFETVNGILRFCELPKTKEGFYIGTKFLPTEEGFLMGNGEYVFHFPSTPYNFLEIEVNVDYQFVVVQGGIYIHNEIF